MMPNEALADLLELSAQVRDVAILGESGFVLASSGTVEQGERLARVASDLMDAAGDLRPAEEVSRIEVRCDGATVFLVREGGYVAIATANPDSVAALMIYDLRTMVGQVDTAPSARPSRKKGKDASDA